VLTSFVVIVIFKLVSCQYILVATAKFTFVVKIEFGFVRVSKNVVLPTWRGTFTDVGRFRQTVTIIEVLVMLHGRAASVSIPSASYYRHAL
jgi:hypothetical protein